MSSFFIFTTHGSTVTYFSNMLEIDLHASYESGDFSLSHVHQRFYTLNRNLLLDTCMGAVENM